MNKLSNERRAQIIRCLADGCSLAATTRICGVSKNAVMRMLVLLGELCADIHNARVRNVRCDHVQIDEVHSFVHTLDQNLKKPTPGRGSIWTWVAFGKTSKLIVGWHLGERTPEDARRMLTDLSERVLGRFQLSSDGLRAYLTAVPDVFGDTIDHATVVKYFGINGKPYAGSTHSQTEVIGVKKTAAIGRPDLANAETAHIERQHLNLRMNVRRYTRRVNSFSKKLENMNHAFAINAFVHNFIRIHSTIKTAPAVAAGLIQKPMTVDELVAIFEESERRAN